MLRSLIAALPSLRCQTPQAATSIAAASSLLASRSVKTTTGIVGLPVDENARENYKTKLQEVLDALKTLIPADAEYRLSVEKTVNHKLAALQSDQTDEQLEELFGFQLEQGIKMCKEELGLIPKMSGQFFLVFFTDSSPAPSFFTAPFTGVLCLVF